MSRGRRLPERAAGEAVPRGRFPALGWALLALTLGYVVYVYRGLGPPAWQPAPWWQPTGALMQTELVAGWAKNPALGIALLSAPAGASTLLVFLTTRSALARALSIASIATVALFAFYAFVGSRIWSLFAWRATLVFVATGTAVGFALTAPLLVRSWLRLRPALRLAIYLPLLLGVVVLMRHATGTNPAMPFNLSPWPAVAVMGFDIGVWTIGGVQLGLAVGLLALALRRRRPMGALMLGACVPCIPVVWLLARHSSPGTTALALLAGITLIGVGLCAIRTASAGPGHHHQRALHIALGASLALLPVIAGQSLAAGDFATSRFVRAQALIDQLARYYDEHGVYPDELEELVAGQYLDEIPRPRIGFDVLYDSGWLEPIDFSYQSLGSSYVLEFEATEWVQCAYNPPWSDDELEADEEPLEVEEAWSCPDSRPDLW